MNFDKGLEARRSERITWVRIRTACRFRRPCERYGYARRTGDECQRDGAELSADPDWRVRDSGSKTIRSRVAKARLEDDSCDWSSRELG